MSNDPAPPTATTLAGFEPLWQALTPHEQVLLVHRLVDRIEYDGAANTVAVTFHPAGIPTLADEIATRQQEGMA